MSEEEKPEYFYRLIYLVVDIGTETLCEVLKKDIPGQDIQNFLKSQKEKIEKMKFLNTMQLSILTANPPEVSKLDISLLVVLIRNLTGIQPPNRGWKIDYPESSDNSPGAQLVRLRSVRNGVIAHKSKGRLTQLEFEKRWGETENVLLKLAGYVSETKKDEMKQKIDEAKTKQLIDQPHIAELLEKLAKWHMEEIEKDHQETKRRLKELENKVTKHEGQQEEINSLKACIREMQRQLKLVGLEAGPMSADYGAQSTSETDGMNSDLDQIGDLVHQVLTTTGVKLIYRRADFNEQPSKLPTDNPNALTGEDIEEYAGKLNKDPCRDWEIFGVYLGYKQTQLDELQKTYENKLQTGFRVMLQRWHSAVIDCRENPKELLAAAFIGIHDDRTAEKILLELKERNFAEVKKLRPMPKTEKKIQEIEFQTCQGIDIYQIVGGPNSMNNFAGSSQHQG